MPNPGLDLAAASPALDAATIRESAYFRRRKEVEAAIIANNNSTSVLAETHQTLSKSELKRLVKRQLDVEFKNKPSRAPGREHQAQEQQKDSHSATATSYFEEDIVAKDQKDINGFLVPVRCNTNGNYAALSLSEAASTSAASPTPGAPDGEQDRVLGHQVAGYNLSAVDREDTSELGKMNHRGTTIVPAHTELLDIGSPLLGKEKFLGGARGADGCIYAMPGHASKVLKIHPDHSANDASRDGQSLTSSSSTCAAITELLPIDSPHAKGEFKWLRGVLSPTNGCVYGIPSWSDHVLKIDTNPNSEEYNKITLLPLPQEFHGVIWKWHGGLLGVGGSEDVDGNVYGVPCSALGILKINTKTDEVTVFGKETFERWLASGELTNMNQKWYGGQTAYGDGSMFAIPHNANKVLRFCPRTEHLSLIGPDLGSGGEKWHGGNVSRKDGCIYGIPNNTEQVLRIDPERLTVDRLGTVPGGRHRQDGKYKYLGGVEDGEGNIYCVPGDADRVLKIQVGDLRVAEVERGSDDLEVEGSGDRCHQNKSSAAVLETEGVEVLAENEYEATARLRATTTDRNRSELGNTQTNGQSSSSYSVRLQLIGDSLHEACGHRVQNKWQNGFLGRDGFIYCIPLKAETVLRISTCGQTTATPSVSVLPIPGREEVRKGNNKWEGGVMGEDGLIYCMPLVCKYVLRIRPEEAI